MAGAPRSVLSTFTLNLVLLASQLVSDFMTGAAGSVLTALTCALSLCRLNRK